MNLKNVKEKYGLESGLKITTKAGFKATFGFGSSSAVTVCTAKAVSELFGLNLDNKSLFDICYKTVIDVQGKGSGFDLAAAIWGGTLLFQNKGEIVEPLNIPNFDLAVGYTGQKYDTVKVVNEVLELQKIFPEMVGGTYDNIEYLVNKAIENIKQNPENQDLLTTLGHYMNFNQGQLEGLGVSSVELYQIIFAAKGAGAFGAKLSGAGKGDCAVALVNNSNKQTVQEAIKNAGFEVIEANVGAEGVRMES
jgi:mevalonate kinase